MKFALCEAGGDVDLMFRGQVEGIGVAPCLAVRDAQGMTVAERKWPAEGFDHDAATRELLATGGSLLHGRWWGSATGFPLLGVKSGEVVVHTGREYCAAPV